MSTTKSFTLVNHIALDEKFQLMEQERYASLSSLTGYPISGYKLDETRKSADTWKEVNISFQYFVDVGRIFFKRSVEIRLNKKNGKLVVYDELIASKSGDVKLIFFSERKHGKEGHIADCVACYLTNVILGMRLRQKGENKKAML